VGRRNTEGGGARWTQLGLTGGAVPEDHPSSPDENSGLAVRESGGTTSLRARPRSQASLGGVCQQVPGFSVTVCVGGIPRPEITRPFIVRYRGSNGGHSLLRADQGGTRVSGSRRGSVSPTTEKAEGATRQLQGDVFLRTEI
jgi:hypothetical protein